jgi:hypothetical protein
LSQKSLPFIALSIRVTERSRSMAGLVSMGTQRI